MPVKDFEDLEIWKEARRLTYEIYNLSRDAKVFERLWSYEIKCNAQQFQLCRTSQKDLSAVEIKNSSQFLYVAKGSCGELRSQLYVALDQAYIDHKVTEDLLKFLKRLSVMIKHLIDHLKRSGMRGPKYGDSSRSSYSETS